jgi:hypothetical protein
VLLLVYTAYFIVATVPVLAVAFPVLYWYASSLQKKHLVRNRLEHRLNKAAKEPVQRLQKSVFSGLQVIRAFNRSAAVEAEFEQVSV